MTDVPTITDLDKVVEPHLGDAKLLTYASRYLTKPGDNYGSILLAVDAKILIKDGTIKDITLVAKLPPITNAMLWQMFQPERTCKTENAIYQYYGPAIRELQLEAGHEKSKLFDGLSKYYGSRIALDPEATTVDVNALLVLENLQVSGFRAGDRHKMFDLQHAKIILSQIAQFHALGVALRLTKPEEFNQNIRPHFGRFNVNNSMTKEAQIQFEKELLNDVAAATKSDEKILKRMKEMIEEYNAVLNSPEKEDNLYTTIVHFDMWINNFMIKYDEHNTPSRVKIVDFQMAEYESLAYDVVFFMFSSLEINVLDSHLEELLLFYYYSFIECLESVAVSTDQYSYDRQEIHTCAPVALCLCLFMTRVILADDSIMPENIRDMNMDLLSKSDNELVIQRVAEVIRLAQKFNFFFRDSI